LEYCGVSRRITVLGNEVVLAQGAKMADRSGPFDTRQFFDLSCTERSPCKLKGVEYLQGGFRENGADFLGRASR